MKHNIVQFTSAFYYSASVIMRLLSRKLIVKFKSWDTLIQRCVYNRYISSIESYASLLFNYFCWLYDWTSISAVPFSDIGTAEKHPCFFRVNAIQRWVR